MVDTFTSYALAFCRIVIFLTFLYSFVGKVKNISSFEQTSLQFNIVPKYLSRSIALLLLSGEFAVVFLVTAGGRLLVYGFMLSILLLSVFSAALTIVLIRKINTSCNCFGATTRSVSVFDIGRNIGFIICALSGVGLQTMVDAGTASLRIVDWGIVGLIAVTFLAGWLQIGEIVQVFRSES